MISPGWYKDMFDSFMEKDMFDSFFDRFEVKEKGEYGATDALLNKNRGFTLGDMERLFDNPTAYWPLPITCPKCRTSVDVGHLDWSDLVCMSCDEAVERGDWILKGFEE